MGQDSWKKAFSEYMHLIPDPRGHIEFQKHELSSKSGKNLKIGNVTGGHGYQRFGLKKTNTHIFKLVLHFSQLYECKTRNIIETLET